MADVSVSRQIAAPPDVAWGLVSDLPRMGEWSPETEGGSWVGGATGPTTGAKFKGDNANDGRSWKTTATVTEAEAPLTFAFDVKAAGLLPIAAWRFDVEPTESRCVVTQSWTDRRPGWFKPIATKITGVADRAEYSRGSMEQTLAALSAEAESSRR